MTSSSFSACMCAANSLVLSYGDPIHCRYWWSKRSYVGISVSSLASSLVCQAIVLAYLWNENASILVLGPAAVRIMIHIWKVGTVFMCAIGCPKHRLMVVVSCRP